MRRKSNVSEGCNSGRRLQLCREARKRRERSRRGLKKQGRDHRSDSKLNGSEVPADVSVKQQNKVTARRLLDQSEGNARRHEKDSNNSDDVTSDKSTYTTSNFVFRNDVSKDEQGLNVRPLLTNSHQRI